MDQPDAGNGHDERVTKLARKLLRDGDGFDSMEQAIAAAQAILEESDERMHDPAAHDHDHPGKIRRTSSETATSGDTGITRRAHSGE